MNKTLMTSALALACAFGLSSLASAAELVVVNGDAGTGLGLDDPTPKAPQGGNPGTTLGEQRRIAYQFAADLWGSVIESNVDIKVGATFQPLTCDATGAVLGSAGPNWIDRDFPNAPLPGYWYHSALADSLAGVDLDPVPDDPLDIVSRFNGDIGVRPDCLTGADWYYGLDGLTPAGNINFLNVVMHEIGHGLGFSGFLNKTTGAFINADGVPRPDAYTHFAFDNVQGLRFDAPAMTNALRALAMRTPGRTVWDGAKVKTDAALILDDQVLLRTSGTLTAGYAYGTAGFGPVATAANFTGALALANDGAGPDTADACEALPAGSLSGRIAFVNRGACGFELKALNAGNAGAVAVLIGNVATSGSPTVPPGMADDPTIVATVPTLSVALADADAIRAALPGVNVTLGAVAGRLAGADAAGRVQLYSPPVVAGGSTFSHYDTAVSPNVLMEPFITSTLNAQYNLDLTPSLYQDMGWRVNAGNGRIGSCDTSVDALEDGGLIIGANVSAFSNVCEVGSSRPSEYLKCMLNYSKALKNSGLITQRQNANVTICAARRTQELIRESAGK